MNKSRTDQRERRHSADERTDEKQTELTGANSSVMELFPAMFSGETHMCGCVLHFHCCRNIRQALCGIWDSEPARMDQDLRLNRKCQEKAIHQSQLTLTTATIG